MFEMCLVTPTPLGWITVKPLANGTLLTVSIDALLDYLDNDEAYFMFRLPHKNLDALFRPQILFLQRDRVQEEKHWKPIQAD